MKEKQKESIIPDHIIHVWRSYHIIFFRFDKESHHFFPNEIRRNSDIDSDGNQLFFDIAIIISLVLVKHMQIIHIMNYLSYQVSVILCISNSWFVQFN